MTCRCLTRSSVALVLVACGCASPWKKEYLVDISGDGVLLYRQYEEVDGNRVDKGYLHPFDIPVEEMEVLLARLVYVRDPFFGAPKDTLIFTPEEVKRAAPRLVAGLGIVQADERLRFLIPRRYLHDFFTATTGVTGIVFRTEAESLNIAFDAIDQGIHEGEYGRPEEVTFPYDPTALTREDPLVALPGSKLHRDEIGQLYPRWLEVDLASLKKLTAAPVATPGVQPTRAPAPSTPGARTETAEQPAPPTLTPEEEARLRDIRKKLESLKRLKADGVITEEEYEKVFGEIMKEL